MLKQKKMIKKTKTMIVPSDLPELLQGGKRILLPGKMLLNPHGTMVYKGEKKAIVTCEKFAKYVDIPIYLIEDDLALAIIRIKPAKEINKEDFKKLSKFHLISEKEREEIWPYEEVFYYYKIEVISKFSPGKKIIKPDGAYSWLDSVVFKSLDIGDPADFKKEDLVRGHELIHGLWSRLDAASDECIKYHILFTREMLKRKLKHETLDSLDNRSKEIEEKLAKKGFSISFEAKKGIIKIEKSDESSEPKKLSEEVVNYLFEPNNNNLKEKGVRWNLSLSSNFDVESVESVAASFEYEMFSRFLNCDVKKIYQNSYEIPGPMMGTYLSAFSKILSEFELVDCRNFTYSGKEVPLEYETIKLNSQKSDDFLVNGTSFYQVEGDNKVIMKVQPTMYSLQIQLLSSIDDKNWNKGLLNKVHEWTNKNNFLRGEIFGLSGDFLNKTTDVFDDLILDDSVMDSIKKSVSQLNSKGEKALSRGMMFVGKPGTGKTKTGRVLMNALDNATFIWVSSRDFDKIGPVSALKMAFNLSRRLTPAILFMEDIDTWLKSYSMDLLKTEMDGLKGNDGMITILTSNNPEEFPDALLDRPGRFHDVLEFSLPTKDMRKTMILKWTNEKISDELMKSILDETEGYSGAHIKELVDFAKMIKVDDGLDTGKSLLKSLEKLKRQKALIDRIKRDKKKEINNLKSDTEEVECI